MTAATSTPCPDAAALPKRRKRRVPSERNRQVFVEVVIKGREQPEVARELKITQQRVSQIIEQFYGWLAENVPPQAAGMSAEEQLRLAANVTYLRLEHVQMEAQRNYRQSTKEIESLKIRYSAKGKELGRVITYKSPRGTCSHLNAARRACQEKWAVARMAIGLLGRGIEVEGHLAEGAEERGRQVKAGETPFPRTKSAQRKPKVTAGETPAPRGPRKVLCGSPPKGPSQEALTSTLAAATRVSQPNCASSSQRKPAGSDVHARFFKPCVKPLSDGNSDRRGRSPAVGSGHALVQAAHPNHDLAGRAANCPLPDAGP